MSSIIKVDNIQDQCGSAVVTKCGSTVTLGASGDTIQLACGASQTGFGRTGTVNWDTTAKTTNFTAVSGNGYFVNTTSGAITVTLPATPSAGDIVSLSDYTNTWQTNNVTVARNGSPIGGVAANAVLSTEGQSVTFIYVDGTEGWKNVQDSTSNVTGNPYIVATGGTITTCGDYKIHTFTSPGTFCVSSAAVSSPDNTVDYLVVAGGGAGGYQNFGGGGGGGGFRFYANTTNNPQSGPGNPLNNFPAGTAITVTATCYPITVGSGGAGVPAGTGNPGSNSVFSTITSAGGGGGSGNPPGAGGQSGGSGGGGCSSSGGGAGNTPPVSPAQGTPGFGPPAGGTQGSGGGGAIVGGPGNNINGGNGGGITGFGAGNGECSSCIQYFSGGGGAFKNPGTGGSGGLGGGGGGSGTPPAPDVGAGDANTGGGGGANTGTNGNGGSGIVIIRYKYQ